MNRLRLCLALLSTCYVTLIAPAHAQQDSTLPVLADIQAANTERGTHDRRIRVDLVVLQQNVLNNRLGAKLDGAQIFALRRDVTTLQHPFDAAGQDQALPASEQHNRPLNPGQVRLRSYKRPRPLVLRANMQDELEIHLHNLLPEPAVSGLDCNGPSPDANNQALTTAYQLSCVGLQIAGLDWLDDANAIRIAPGAQHVYRFRATEEGVFMLFSPNGQSIPNSHNDHYLFGAVNVQPLEAEWYRSQVTREDLRLATYRVSPSFLAGPGHSRGSQACDQEYGPTITGLPPAHFLRRQWVRKGQRSICPPAGAATRWLLSLPTDPAESTEKISEVLINLKGELATPGGHPVVNYQAIYPAHHPRAGSPILNMLSYRPRQQLYELHHSDLTAIITGPQAGRFPYYLDLPAFRENPATPDRRQPYREFTINYHISPLTQQAFKPFSDASDPLFNTLQAGADGFAVNYGIAGIGPEIYANRINVGPMGINQDGVDLLFEEFFLSAWAVGDPAVLTDIPANNPKGKRATKALYPDDPSNVYHSYMRDHVKMRVLNTGSVAPHVHHQHAHQWLHSPNSDDGHYLDSQMINPGSTYTLEMTYNGSGNRNQTVGDSIFHCHIYPHFAQGMWGLWRVHDVFEAGTQLDHSGHPIQGARALPDGEIVLGTPIPALVPLPTLGMAPLPGPAQLSADGRRVIVTPSGTNRDGKAQYQNPGFPFFVPGLAGHRAPHPPLDFAWKEGSDGQPMLYAEKNLPPFRRPGQRQYLDGGLPRHLVIGGTVASEFHTRWDFSKDIVAYDQTNDRYVGEMIALEIPEEGTAAEQAAMAAHAIRTHSSYQPDGRPGNFILNGLPPAPGAPYAAPEVDDNGNSTFNSRRYKAAVIQQDVVFNKEGWHYPQQRFITLLDDVKNTVAGKKPPEPFFFRASTGETVEFWHTNLVPKDYALDDFQVRTPTDILGQHIHLVKFDVTSSDGAGNGFNYEDGTFSPDEVRERIQAINNSNGLYHFNPKTQYLGQRQTRLKVSSYLADYGPGLGEPPPGQDWNGAQTTIQRFDTDPLLNHLGQDRTLRTVFTHDHFGPSTHQQVGLYGAMLVEPSGSTWKNAITGCPMPDFGTCETRTDGGPTSWQAIIETNNRLESYREFAFASSDLQLAYGRDSMSSAAVISGPWFITASENYPSALDQGQIPPGLRETFRSQGAVLGDHTAVSVIQAGQQWLITRNQVDQFGLRLEGSNLNVTQPSMAPAWADADQAIWPPTGSASIGASPYPSIISDPGGGGNIGGWMVNYRNEPLDARLQAGNNSSSFDPSAADPAFAYASLTRANPRLNQQPAPGAPISTQTPGFHYPQWPLVPEGASGVQGSDPYTPLLRAYAGDKVEMRVVVGAVDSVHTFQVQGARWFAEPSYSNSGYRNSQGMGISEHFEMIFELPPAGATAAVNQVGTGQFVDYLYAPSASTQGQAKGAWGILRSYENALSDLQALPQNAPASASNKSFYQPPTGATVRDYTLAVELGSDSQSLQYRLIGPSNGQTPEQTLVLRANAGDWLHITLRNKLTVAQAAQLKTQWNTNNPQSSSASSAVIQPYSSSAQAGIHASLLSYDTSLANGMVIGFNGVGSNGQNDFQTIPPGGEKSIYWYAGEIRRDASGQRQLQPIEFGAVNLLPADPLLQESYGLTGVLIVEPVGSQWSPQQAHSLGAQINDAQGQLLFTEIIVSGNIGGSASAPAGSEVRLRVLNPGSDSPGVAGDNTNLIAIEGHGWPEEPYTQDSSVIGENPWSQWLGTQQVTPTESYNLILPSAGGEARLPGVYDYYYYPLGPQGKIGSLTVTPLATQQTAASQTQAQAPAPGAGE